MTKPSFCMYSITDSVGTDLVGIDSVVTDSVGTDLVVTDSVVTGSANMDQASTAF